MHFFYRYTIVNLGFPTHSFIPHYITPYLHRWHYIFLIAISHHKHFICREIERINSASKYFAVRFSYPHHSAFYHTLKII